MRTTDDNYLVLPPEDDPGAAGSLSLRFRSRSRSASVIGEDVDTGGLDASDPPAVALPEPDTLPETPALPGFAVLSGTVTLPGLVRLPDVFALPEGDSLGACAVRDGSSGLAVVRSPGRSQAETVMATAAAIRLRDNL
jgi:hypothetical protein